MSQARGGQLEWVNGRRVFQPQRSAPPARRFSGLAGNLLLLAALVLVIANDGLNTPTLIGVGCLTAAWLLTLPAAIHQARHPAPQRPLVLNDSLVDEVRALKRQGDRMRAIRVVRDRTGLGLRDAVQIVELTP